jgi:hypothetical protein
MRTFPVSAGLLEHKQRMGAAVWEYLWLLDHVTSDEPGEDGKFLGIVQFGQALSAETVSRDLKESLDTAKVNLRKLCAEGYVSRRRVVGAGYAYVVLNSKKWIWKRENGHRVENPPMGSHRVENPSTENLPDVGKKPADDRRETPSNNKESKTLGRVGRENHSPLPPSKKPEGGLWNLFKLKLKDDLSSAYVHSPNFQEQAYEKHFRDCYLAEIEEGGNVVILGSPDPDALRVGLDKFSTRLVNTFRAVAGVEVEFRMEGKGPSKNPVPQAPAIPSASVSAPTTRSVATIR